MLGRQWVNSSSAGRRPWRSPLRALSSSLPTLRQSCTLEKMWEAVGSQPRSPHESCHPHPQAPSLPLRPALPRPPFLGTVSHPPPVQSQPRRHPSGKDAWRLIPEPLDQPKPWHPCWKSLASAVRMGQQAWLSPICQDVLDLSSGGWILAVSQHLRGEGKRDLILLWRGWKGPWL